MITEIHVTGDELNALNKKVGGIYMPKQMTEQEYLQTCNTEQLAEAITDIVYECRDSDDCMDCRLGWCSKDCVVEWLKQPHTNKE